MADRLPVIDSQIVRAVASALTDGPGGLTNSEIDLAFEASNLAVPPPGTKRRRVGDALLTYQARQACGNAVVRFLREALHPVRYTADPARFRCLQEAVNEPLSLAALQVNDKGQVAHAKQATTLDEVAVLAGRLRRAAVERGSHPEVLRYCEREIVERNPFHAMQEAVKGVAERLRAHTGFGSDGANLIQACFGGEPALIQLTSQVTESDKSVQKGFLNLLIGVFGHFRNPTAHAPRRTWPVAEQDVLDLFSTLSYVHRRLDQAEVRPSPTSPAAGTRNKPSPGRLSRH
jgi:uncharacterized protein (TIGR02391 family)